MVFKRVKLIFKNKKWISNDFRCKNRLISVTMLCRLVREVVDSIGGVREGVWCVELVFRRFVIRRYFFAMLGIFRLLFIVVYKRILLIG